jgi:NitT/TauT family transport system substrate-binding protein
VEHPCDRVRHDFEHFPHPQGGHPGGAKASPMILTRRQFAFRTAAVASAAIALPRTARAQSQSEPVLRLGIIASDPFGEAIYVQAGGFFKRANLNVELVPLPNSAAIAAALAGGSINVGLGNPIVIASARVAGLPYYAFAPSAVFDASAPTTLLMVANASPIKTAKDLEGKIIGSIELGGITQASLRSWLIKNGVDPAAVRFVEIPFGAMAAALAQGRIDAGFIAEPALGAARATTREIGDPYAMIANQWCLNMWFSTKDWLTKNSALAHRFVDACYKGAAWANTHQTETAAALKAFTPLTDDAIAKMTRIRFATTYSPALLQPALDTGYKFNIFKSPIGAADLMFPGF